MSRLTDTIALLYRMHDADVRALEDQLLEARKRAWATALRQEAAAHGCAKVPNAPRRDDLAELRRQSRDDARSIARTYNAEVTREIERIYADNPRANRNVYFSRLERWAAERDAWKRQQIALVADTTAAEYAREQFRRYNYTGEEQYVFAGPPPTCEDCASRFAAGIVGRTYIERYPAPRHIGCPHSWTPVRRPRLDCRDIWLG